MLVQRLFRLFSSKSQRQKRLFLDAKSFIPEIAYLDPREEGIRRSFLAEKRFEEERKALAEELEIWIELLKSNSGTDVEMAEICRQKEAKYQQILIKGITVALDEARRLETAYRTLDSFFRNAGTDYIDNLTLVNANRWDIVDCVLSEFDKDVGQLLENSFERIDLKNSYSLLVIPDLFCEDSSFYCMLKWAGIAFKYKALLITDHADETNFEDLYVNTANYCYSDHAFQNVVMTANWIVGRNSEMLSEFEKESPAFFIPSSAALAGRIYAESANIEGVLNNRGYHVLNETKGVHIDLLKSEIASLMDNQVVPMAFLNGRVVACNDSNLYNGCNYAVNTYPIVLFLNWLQKELIQIVNSEARQDRYDWDTPDYIKDKIRGFLLPYYKDRKIFETFVIENSSYTSEETNYTFEIGLTIAKDLSRSYSSMEQNIQHYPSFKIRVTYCKRNLLKCMTEIVEFNYKPKTM